MTGSAAGQIYRRKSDGREIIIDQHRGLERWVLARARDTGRTFWLTEDGIRRKYELVGGDET